MKHYTRAALAALPMLLFGCAAQAPSASGETGSITMSSQGARAPIDGAPPAPVSVIRDAAPVAAAPPPPPPRAAAAPRPAPAPVTMAPPRTAMSAPPPPIAAAASRPDPRAQLPGPELVVDQGSNVKFKVVRVFFATDRNTTADTRPEKMFGTERSNPKYGTVAVSIPRDHRLGEIERPTLRKLQLREDPEKHVVLMNISMLDKEPFFTTLAQRIKASAGKSSFVFVHGYNVSFADAARRTAQMHYDLGFDGAPIFYSWPSQASTAKYTVDEANIEWSQSNLRAFLQELLAKSEPESVYLVAHSMGNRALTNALAAIAEQPGAAGKVREVILAAPDIDADVFKRDIAPSLKKLGAGVTLYASSADRALIASKTVHGSPRAGDSGTLRVVTPGVETIDASGIDTSWLGHSYFAEVQSLIADMLNLVRNHQRAEGRTGLVKEVDAAGNYWRIKK